MRGLSPTATETYFQMAPSAARAPVECWTTPDAPATNGLRASASVRSATTAGRAAARLLCVTSPGASATWISPMGVEATMRPNRASISPASQPASSAPATRRSASLACTIICWPRRPSNTFRISANSLVRALASRSGSLNAASTAVMTGEV